LGKRRRLRRLHLSRCGTRPVDVLAQPRDHHSHQHQRELGFLAERCLQLLIVEGYHAAGGTRHPVALRGPWLIDAISPKTSPWRTVADRLVVVQDAYLAVEQQVHALAQQQERNRFLVLAEYFLAPGETLRLAAKRKNSMATPAL